MYVSVVVFVVNISKKYLKMENYDAKRYKTFLCGFTDKSEVIFFLSLPLFTISEVLESIHLLSLR